MQVLRSLRDFLVIFKTLFYRLTIEGFMEKIKQVQHWIALFLVFLLLALFIVGVNQYQNQPRMLYPGEIQDYQGENLSLISEVVNNAIGGTQYLNASTYRLEVTGLVNKTLEISYDNILNDFQSYQKIVTLRCVQGWQAKILWEGFLVSDLLNKSGVNSDAVAAIFYASDGYSTFLPLEYLNSKEIMIAYKMNGLTLPPERGFPFQLVAESQFGYKWIKWLTRIEVTDNQDYLGTWERHGYPNNASLPVDLP
jgi:DMSO/TMAO reductase YedYZ molybdopterin-dependent catalytic subunit